MALVGGVNTMVTPEGHIAFAKAGMLAPDGRCKTFSPDADGYGRGEGVGMILVRRLSDAERDGDPILAIVRGTGINHGGHAQSLTAPNTRAQADLLRSVYARAGVDPRSVGYVEAHGTGTALGDPVEINALKSAFRSLPERDEGIAGVGCAIGAVKTNIGHLELAAGMAGVIKVLKQIEHRQIAPSLHCEALNPFIDLGDSPFEIVRGQRPWMPARDASGAALPLRAGVSSFGFGGVNAHVILEEYRQPAPLPVAAAPGAQPPAIVVLSSRDGERLKESAQNLLAVLDSGRIGNADLHDLAHTLQVGRAAMAERLAVVAASVAALQAQLGHFLAGESAADLHFGRAHVNADALSPGAKPADIARHWAGGGTVDWRAIDPAPRRRLRLPTYPFARDIYRIDGDGASKAATRATATPAAEASFTDTRLEADAFYLRDHRVQGSRILPGAMSLELVRRAAAGVDGVGTATLSGLTWRRPLELNSGTIDVRVETTATRTASSGFRLVARDDPQSDYVRGTVAATTPAEAPQTIDLESSKAACRRVHDPDWLYAAYAALGIAYGPSFRSVVGLWSGNGQVLAQLRLPTAEASGCYLHPAMLDAAFQAAMALFVDDDDAQLALPFGIERMEVYAPTTGAMWAHLRTVPSGAAIRKLDIDLADESGRLCVRIEGFSLRRLATLPEGRTLPGVAPETATPGRDVAETYFVGLVAHASGMDAAAISVSAPLEEYGIDSIMITRLTDRLEEDFGQLSRTLFFEHQTLGALIGHFRERHGARLASVAGAQPERVARSAPPQAASGSSRKISGSGEPIAIIGLAGRYPGARTLPEFWRNLAAGRDSVTEIPADRWDHRRFFDPQRQAGKTTSRWGGFVDGHDRFDPLFFNIAPRDAQFIDPQERLFLQCAWETLEDAGYTRDSIAPGAAGGGDVGVFVGVMYQEYQLYGPERSAQGQPMALTGSAASIANRVSYFCNFQGPSLAVDSMCSSSLTAIHLACDSLRAGSCAVALAGGVNLTLHPNKYLALAQGRFLSSTGRCESFGEGGDGYVPAEGVGAVLLKPLRQAEADGDRIHGVILGSALNHGGKTNGYTVPNPAAQAAVIAAAMARAGVRPGEVSYVEAHGTGTSLGDPIEIAALSQAYGGERAGSVAIGSVKSNIGHGESAAGIAGLTKLLLQMRHSQFAPSLHAETLNPNIAWDETPFRVQRELQPWEREAGGLPRIAGLSSFGAGGSNAHVILAEYRHADEPAAEPRPDIYPLSARSPERLQAAAESLLAALNDLNAADLPAVAHVLQEGREAFEERLAIVAGNKDELAEKLGGVLSGRETAGTVRGRARRVAGEDGHAPGPEAMAEAWVRGVAIDWAARRTGLRPRPVSLPTYPFATEHCWLPDAADAAPLPTPAAASRLGLPLLFAPVWQERPRRSAVLPPETSRLVILCGVDDASFHDASRARSVDIVRLQASAGSIDERYAFYAARLMELLQRLARDRPAAAVVQVVVPATGRDAPLEGLAGMLRCVSLEHPTIACQLVAVETGVDGLPTRLAEDAAHAAGDRDIRHLAGRRLVRSWREATPGDAAIASPWKHGGSYLLTGGAGGIGLHVAGAIAAAGGHVALWLTGRSPLDPGIRQRLEALEAAGATARYRRVDLLDEAAMSALLREIELADGRLAGVFHGAGISRDGRFLGKDAATLRAVLAPKVAGTRILDAAIGDRPLDFMLLFASAAGAVGNPGQADYGAANGFLDAFATARNAEVARGLRQGRTIAVDWPYWRDGGMQMPDRAIAAMAREVGARPLETGPALAALAAVLAMPDEQLLVLDGDHDRLRRLMRLADVAPPPAEAASAAPVVAGTVADPAGAADRRALVATILSCFSAVLGIAESRLSLDDTIDRFGVDSVSATQIVEAMEARLGPLPQTLLFEFPTIGRLADELLARQAAAVATTQELIVNANTPAVEGLPAGAFQDQEAASSRDIAIIAVAGRYPGADTIEAFGAALRAGRDGITEIPPDRTELLPRFSERKGEPGASYCRWGGFLSDVDRFDAAFFGYSPRAAALADPQERLFLQTAWHLLERAGHTRAHLAHHYEARVGVFVGAMYNQYPALAVDSDSRAMLALSSYSGIANRTSFFFDLQGPSIAVDSMCSAGLQAVHLACQSLRAGECRLAIAGGVNLSIHPAKYEALSRGGLVGSDAGSRPFSGGDGYLPAEGVGAVLLKPLRDARRDGERILGVIKGSLANHSGHSAGYAVPSVDAQVRLLDGAFRRAGIDKATIGYVEAAANGSSLGDAIELRALTRVFAEAAPASIALGSVKANIGHAEAASGLAQLTKVLLQFDQKSLFPSPGLGSASAADAFHGTPFTPQTELLPWAAPVTGGEPQPRRATVSAFGAGGSNVHLILEEGPIPPDSIAEALGPRLFPVSARTDAHLAELRLLLADHLAATPGLSMGALSRTLIEGREAFDCRIDIVATDQVELARKLADQGHRESPETLATAFVEEAALPAMLVLPGYPFARERHWLPGAAPEQAGAGASAALPPPAASPPAAEPGETPLRLISRTLAAELGLAIEAIQPDDRFDALGVDSMIRMRLIYAVEATSGLIVDHRTLATHQTPRALAAFVEGEELPLPVATVPRAPDRGNGRAFACPLGESQKGLWVLQRLVPERGDYNVPLAFTVRSVDASALDAALAWLTQEHPLLACRIVDDGKDVALAARSDAVRVRAVAMPKEVEAAEFLRQRVLAPFDLGQGVFRAEHVSGGRLAMGESVVLLVAHHIVTDGLSSALIAQRFWAAYDHFATGAALPEPELGADYADFVAWETAFAASAEGQAQKAYWLDRLAGPLPQLRLPSQAIACPQATADGRVLECRLPPAMTERLREAAARLGCGAAAFYLGAFATLLYRYTGETDLVVGVPTLRRPSRRFASTVGYCANMIALRLALDPARPFADLAASVQGALAEGLDNADYPFAAIARERGGTATGEPPYQVTFAYQNFGSEAGDMSPFARGGVSHMAHIRQIGDTALGLEVQDDASGALLVVTYDGNRFSDGIVEAMVAHLRRILEVAIAPVAPAPSVLPMLTPPEINRSLHHWSRSGALPAAAPPIHEQIFAQAERTPAAIAMAAGPTRLSYRQLVARVRQIARLLRRQGVGPGDAVAVLLPREPDMVAALVAVMSIGAVWVPVDPTYPDARVLIILRDIGAVLVLCRGSTAERVRELEGEPFPVVDLDRARPGLLERFARPVAVTVGPSDPAYVIYTSGSTGTPKGVVVSHGALSEHCQVIARQYELTAGDGVLQFASSAVDTAIEQILPTLAAGARLVLRPDQLPTSESFRAFLAEAQVTVADLPPVYLQELLASWERSGADLEALKLRLLIVGGETLAPEVVALWARGPLARRRLLNAYGPTEATVTALVHEVRAGEQLIPIGRPLPGTEIYILDPDGNMVPDGIVGELHIGGRRLAAGYHGRADLTDRAFRVHRLGDRSVRLYRTGDLACFRPRSGGVVEFHGRADAQVKVRGFRVELGEIEAAIGGASGCQEVAVLAERSLSGDASLTAYVGACASDFDEPGVRQLLSQRLPAHMVPSVIVRLDRLPTTTSGKIDRAALRNVARPDVASAAPRAPRDALEMQIMAIWIDVLGLDPQAAAIGIDDDFASVGGNSLLAVRLLGRLENALGSAVSVADLAHACTIADQARLLRQRGYRERARAPVDVEAPPSLSARAPQIVLLQHPTDGGYDAKTPLFLIHAIAGTLTCYQTLVAELNTTRPVYGIRAVGLESGEACDGRSIEDLAASYCDQIRAVQPRGPYRLCGWSFGGVVAYEMARQLQQAGEAVAFLGLIDSYTPDELAGPTGSAGDDGVGLRARNFLRDLFGIGVAPAPGQDVVDFVMGLPQLSMVLPGASADDIRRLFAVFCVHYEAFAAYRPGTSDTSITLVRCEGTSGGIGGWRGVARSLTLHRVAGDHYGVLVGSGLAEWLPILRAALDGRDD
ncbi:amino acid adenylation domain-containing protein [Aurantimonas aggregata]|uniref:Amino acid adenylation domain-containing protein n=1 Tax=Aurantimonas aggregata TaxID=2047720 RepID=A0A6L9MCE2_9HYPH|nr:non-ribosomal peptide synthetase [Aurantimonas aggregata]NDV85371.1 amino acid adenylation domain-containing protein [Aurantimonas aggregata]